MSAMAVPTWHAPSADVDQEIEIIERIGSLVALSGGTTRCHLCPFQWRDGAALHSTSPVMTDRSADK
jgi:hypothetical protein